MTLYQSQYNLLQKAAFTNIDSIRFLTLHSSYYETIFYTFWKFIHVNAEKIAVAQQPYYIYVCTWLLASHIVKLLYGLLDSGSILLQNQSIAGFLKMDISYPQIYQLFVYKIPFWMLRRISSQYNQVAVADLSNVPKNRKIRGFSVARKLKASKIHAILWHQFEAFS